MRIPGIRLKGNIYYGKYKLPGSDKLEYWIREYYDDGSYQRYTGVSTLHFKEFEDQMRYSLDEERAKRNLFNVSLQGINDRAVNMYKGFETAFNMYYGARGQEIIDLMSKFSPLEWQTFITSQDMKKFVTSYWEFYKTSRQSSIRPNTKNDIMPKKLIDKLNKDDSYSVDVFIDKMTMELTRLGKL